VHELSKQALMQMLLKKHVILTTQSPQSSALFWPNLAPQALNKKNYRPPVRIASGYKICARRNQCKRGPHACMQCE
jgi:hypothetical protein